MTKKNKKIIKTKDITVTWHVSLATWQAVRAGATSWGFTRIPQYIKSMVAAKISGLDEVK